MAKKSRATTNPKTNPGRDDCPSKSEVHPPIVVQTSSSSSSLLVKNKTIQQQQQQQQLDLQPLVPGAVYTANSFLSSQECQAWIRLVEEFPKALVYTQHPASRTMAQRECSRWQRQDWEMADALFERMKHSTIIAQLESYLFSTCTSTTTTQMPRRQQQEQQQKRMITAVNGNLRVYKYERTMSFGKHVDGNERTDRGMTQVTVLIYLSNCVGGATRFHFGRKEQVAIDPHEGKILFHVHGTHCLVHEADAVKQGVKYVLRTDLIYNTNAMPS